MIELFCPSRGRPQDAHALAQSFALTSCSNSKLIFLVDSDDPTKDQYPDPQIGEPTGDPTGPLNRAALASTADIIGFIGDDSRLVTHGWDLLVSNALETPGFAWGRDGHDTPWPSTCFVTSGIVKALGYFVPPTLRRGYFDVVWVSLANSTHSARILDADFPHDNSRGDPAKPNYDPAYRVPPEVIEADGIAYNRWLYDESKNAVRAIRHFIYR